LLRPCPKHTTPITSLFLHPQIHSSGEWSLPARGGAGNDLQPGLGLWAYMLGLLNFSRILTVLGTPSVPNYKLFQKSWRIKVSQI